MKKVAMSAAVCLAGVLAAGTIHTGGFVVESATETSGHDRPAMNGSYTGLDLLRNRGFETGSLAPWISANWSVDTAFPHQGSWCAHDVGNYSIRQNVSPTPGSEILSVTFWTRHPDTPAAMAYDFFYSDGSSSEFLLYPDVKWTQYDVTSNLNRQKTLTGFQIWGYSGGGPGPDSTYVDDVSIQRAFDVTIADITGPRDTIQLTDTVYPQARLRNNGSNPESFWLWCRIEHTCSLDVYRDSLWVALLPPGSETTVMFRSWTPRYPGLYRFMISFDPDDTTWQYFWVQGAVAVDESQELPSGELGLSCNPSLGSKFEIRCAPSRGQPVALGIYSSSGALVWPRRLTACPSPVITWTGCDYRGRQLPPGVYVVRVMSGGCAETRKLVLRPGGR